MDGGSNVGDRKQVTRMNSWRYARVKAAETAAAEVATEATERLKQMEWMDGCSSSTERDLA